LNELHNINKNHNLGIKEKLDDLRLYIKVKYMIIENNFQD